MTNQYINREAAKRELLSWAVCMNHPEYLIKDDALHVIDSIPAADKEVLIMTEYIENPLSGKLRGVTYEDGKIIDVHIRDTDDVVKVFVPVRHGCWIIGTGENGLQRGYRKCSQCGEIVKYRYSLYGAHNFCNYCGCLMDGGAE